MCQNLQTTKKAVRSITGSKYNAHTDPIFKSLNILKVADIYAISQLKCYHQFVNDELPKYFKQFHFHTIDELHDHNTRTQKYFHIIRVKQSIPSDTQSRKL
jgi:hypothetical protein